MRHEDVEQVVVRVVDERFVVVGEVVHLWLVFGSNGDRRALHGVILLDWTSRVGESGVVRVAILGPVEVRAVVVVCGV